MDVAQTCRAARQVLDWTWHHPANKHRRFRAVARAAAFQARARLLHRPTYGHIGTMRICAHLHDTSAAMAIYATPPHIPEMLVWQQRLEPDDLFIDVGANVGVYTLWAASLGAAVIAVEPAPAAIAQLRANVALNPIANVAIVEAAVTDSPGRASFTANAAMSHLGGTATVDATTLDAVLGDRHAAGVKIDVEGAERLVLEGAGRALAEHRIDVLQVEWNGMSTFLLQEGREPVAALLRENGYRLCRPDPTGALAPATAEMGPVDMFALAPHVTI